MNMNNLAQTHEILTPQLATKAGLTKFEFYKYVKANEYEQAGHGVFPYFNLICIDTTSPDSSHPLRSFPHKADHKKLVCPGGAANHYTFFTGYRTHGCLSRRACYTLSASVLHSGSQNRKKHVVGCHNRFFQCFIVLLHSSGHTVVKNLPYPARSIPEIS